MTYLITLNNTVNFEFTQPPINAAEIHANANG